MSSGQARRLFFALWPDGATRQALYRATRKVVRQSGGRAVGSKNFHITLAFLGSVTPECLECVCTAAGQVTEKSMKLTLNRLGYFARPRLLWLGPTETPSPLTDLVRNLNIALNPCGFIPDQRSYCPHVTLARRVRRPGCLEAPLSIEWPIARFVLVDSVTGEEGSCYRVLESWLLGAAGC